MDSISFEPRPQPNQQRPPHHHLLPGPLDPDPAPDPDPDPDPPDHCQPDPPVWQVFNLIQMKS